MVTLSFLIDILQAILTVTAFSAILWSISKTLTIGLLVYVGLDLLGDALLKLPLLKCLRQIFPNAQITWLAGKGNSIFRTVQLRSRA